MQKLSKRIWPLFVIAAFMVTCAEGSPLDRSRYGAVEELGEPLTNISIQHCVVGVQDGQPTAYFTVAGRPALFHVVAVNENELLGTWELPNASRAWNHVIAPDGTVYIAGVGLNESGHFYRFLPEENRLQDLGPGIPGHRFVWALAVSDDGRIYGGTWEGGHVFEYNPETGENRDLGRVDSTEDYVRSIAWHDGHVYAGTGMQNGRVWRIHPETGAKERLELPMREEYADQYDRIRGVYHLGVAGDHLFAFLSGPEVMLAYDLKKRQWWEETFPFPSGPVTGVYSETENTFYHAGRENSLWAIDLETREQRKVMPHRGGLRGGAFLEKVSDFPGQTLVTVLADGSVRLRHPESQTSQTLPSRAIGQGTNLQAIENGPGGRIYLSGYIGSSGAAYDPENGNVEIFPIGQAEGIVQFGNRLFWGVYPGARIYEQKPLETDKNPQLRLRIESYQDRPFTMIADDEHVYIGTIPDYGELGGALTVLTPDEDGELKSAVYENVVENQSIVGLARLPGTDLLFGSTSVHGGLGVDVKAEEARLFVWDVVEEKKIEEFALELPGLRSPKMIGGLSVGPDGLIWGAVNGFVFALDPEAREVAKFREILPEVSEYGRWRPVYLRWHEDGLLYLNLASRLIAVDPDTLDHVPLGARSGLLTIGSDGNLYFGNGPKFRRIPVKPVSGE